MQAESIARLMAPIAPFLLAKTKFGGRGLSDKTIQAFVDCSIDFPERLLFMTEKQIRSIPGVGKVSFSEIKAYRDRFLGDLAKAIMAHDANQEKAK